MKSLRLTQLGSYTIIHMSTVDDVEQAMLQGMLRGELPPGTWLRQDELADQLGVSKIPVREALQRLCAIGLVRFESNRGVVVGSLSAAEAEENYSLRRAIEPQLLRRAIPRASIVDLAEAEFALDDTERSLTEANWAFHRALYRPADWQRALAMTEILHAAVAPYVVLYTEGLGAAANSANEHRAILEACRQHDADAAVELLHSHLDEAADTLVTFLQPSEEKPT